MYYRIFQNHTIVYWPRNAYIIPAEKLVSASIRLLLRFESIRDTRINGCRTLCYNNKKISKDARCTRCSKICGLCADSVHTTAVLPTVKGGGVSRNRGDSRGVLGFSGIYRWNIAKERRTVVARAATRGVSGTAFTAGNPREIHQPPGPPQQWGGHLCTLTLNLQRPRS